MSRPIFFMGLGLGLGAFLIHFASPVLGLMAMYNFFMGVTMIHVAKVLEELELLKAKK